MPTTLCTSSGLSTYQPVQPHRQAPDGLELLLRLPEVDRDRGRWYFRRSIPLSNFQPQCALCHPNFGGLPSTAWVGALMLRVPIASD